MRHGDGTTGRDAVHGVEACRDVCCGEVRLKMKPFHTLQL